MCFHKWKEYKDKESKEHYRVCIKCGIAQEYNSCIYGYVTNKYLCRTNNWIDRETWRLRYGN